MHQILQQSPLFVPFNIRNQIINENCTKFKDVPELPNQYELLTSYMPEKQIHDGINVQLSQALFSKKKPNFAVCTSIDDFKKNKVTTSNGLLREIARGIAYSHKSSKLYSGFSFADVALLASLNAGGANIDDTDLAGYWKYDEASSPILNVSQAAAKLTGADITMTGGTPETGSPPVGNAWLLDGINDFGDVGTSLSNFNYRHNQSAKWTSVFWFKLASTPVGDEYIFGNINTDTQIGCVIFYDSSQQIHVLIANGSQVIISGVTTSSYIPDITTWHFYAISYDQSLGSANLKLERDDANAENFSKTANTPSNSNATFAVDVGKRAVDSSKFGNFYINEWSEWQKILSQADQTSLHDGGAGLPIYS